MYINSYQDALTAVYNSGVVDWSWGHRDSSIVLDRLARYYWDNINTGYWAPPEEPVPGWILSQYIARVLGDDPRDYGLTLSGDEVS